VFADALTRSLVRKPGGFARYVYREQMFPMLTSRRAYDALQARLPGLAGDVEYLRVLHLAARTVEADVGTVLGLLLAEDGLLTSERVKALVASGPVIEARERHLVGRQFVKPTVPSGAAMAGRCALG
jgi:hypothetical protein